MTNPAYALHPSLLAEDGPRGWDPLRWLREQVSYWRSMRELNRLDDRTLDDIGIARDQFAMLARRHARGLPPIERGAAG
jgi:uncharacterized protein YjiS (DUF1127 family)